MSQKNEELQQIRAFLFDVDKTLTNTRGEIAPVTQSVIRRLVEQGFQVGVCTGRGYARLFGHVLPLFSRKASHIVSGGAEIVTADGDRLFARRLSTHQRQALIQKALEFQVEFLFDSGSHTYGSERFVRENGLLPYQHCPDPEIPNFVAYYLNAPFREWIAEQEAFEVIEHESAILNTTLFDITTKGVNKATGVAAWASLHEISPSQIAGFGDSYNDLSFLSAVGWSVAMGNAVPELKQQAQAVIGHTDEDGLARYLEQQWLQS